MRRLMVLLSGAFLAAVIALAPTLAGDEKPKSAASLSKEATLRGKVIDLHSFMTGKLPEEEAERHVKMSIRSGVPAVLQTADGPVLIGKGSRGAIDVVTPVSMRDVWARGTVYEKNGLRYLDLKQVRPVQTGRKDDGTTQEGTEEPPPDFSDSEKIDDADLPPDE